MQRTALFLALALVAGSAPAHSTAALSVQEAEPTVREWWERMCAATLLGGARQPKPVTALDLSFEVLTRGDGGSNELKPRVRWLADGSLRVELASGREIGRGPDGDWLRDGEEVVRLVGRDYAEDRRQLDDYLSIIRNFVALTHPSVLTVRNLERVARVPLDFPPRHDLDRARDRKRLVWLAFDSADLAIPGAHATPGEGWRIYLAVDGLTDLPVMALVSDAAGERLPMLLSLARPKALDDLRVPHQIHVYTVVPSQIGDRPVWRVSEKPAQEFYLRRGTVRARLGEDDFRATGR